MENTPDSSILGWAIAGVMTIISALTTGLLTLFRIRESENAKNIEKLETSLTALSNKADKCEEDRHTLDKKCEVLQVQLNVLTEKVGSIDKDGSEFAKKHMP
jgi:chromosome segregation ATPase